MENDRRKYFRISPKTVCIELADHNIELLDISIGGAKFRLDSDATIEKNIIYLYTDEHNFIGIPFHEIKTDGNIWRVVFLPINAQLEVAIAKFIMNWQQQRVLLANEYFKN